MATNFDYTTEIGNTIALITGDTLSFGARSAAKVSFLKVGTDVAVQYYGINGLETVYLFGATLSNLNAAQFTFSTLGESISVFGPTNIVAGEIVGTVFTDVITGGAGGQSLFGDTGNDTYVFSTGDGVDIIDDFDGTAGNVDTISFTNVLPSDVTSITDSVLRDGFDLILKYGPGDQITVLNYFDVTGSNQVIEQIQFSDGTIWDQTDIKNLAVTYGTEVTDSITGGADTIDGYNGGINTIYGLSGDDVIIGGDLGDTIDGGLGNDSISGASGADNITGADGNDYLAGDAGDDTIYGDADNDNITGGTGNDTLSDNAGNDTYTFSVGDGVDTIDDVSTALNTDKIIFTNVASTAATLERHGDNLVIKYGLTDSVTVTNYFLSTDNTIETIQFSNESFSVAEVNAKLIIVGTEGADAIYAPDGQDNTIDGLGGNDFIVGGDQVDLIDGGAGNDSISGSAGDDLISGSAGDDYVAGDAGNDALDGGDGNDTLVGVDGNDTLSGAAGDDALLGEAGDDQLYGDEGNDALSGGAGLDTLSGGLGNDLLDGGSEEDLLVGEDGDDTLIGGTGADLLFGDLGNDTYQFTAGDGVDVIEDLGGDIDTVVFTNVSYASASVTRSYQDLQIAYGTGHSDVVTITNYFTGTANLIEIFQFTDQTLTAAQIEAPLTIPTFTITGGAGDDILDGFDSAKNIINGLDGNDTINGADLADTIDGGDGNDQISGNAGNDSIKGSAGDDYLAGDAGDDTLSGGAGNDELHGGAGDDLITDVGGGNNSLFGEDGNDTFLAVAGNESLYGGAGDDTYTVSNGPFTSQIVILDSAGSNDQISFSNVSPAGITSKVRLGDDLVLNYGTGGTSQVTVTNYFLHPDNLIEKISFQDGSFWTESDVKNLVDTLGTDFADTIIGYDGGGNNIFGLAGNDTISGGNISDGIQGNDGDDQISGNAGDDVMSGDLGNDYLSGDAGNDTLDGGEGLDTLVGGDGNDSLVGWIGDDNLSGGDGADTLNGDDGLDIVSGGLGDDTISGGADADYLAGDEGNDTVYGDDGDDALLGGLGDDTLNGDAGNDQLNGGDGADSVYGSFGLDTIAGGQGNDYLNGADGNDTYIIAKGDGIDTIEDAEIPANIDTVSFTNVQSTDVTSLTSVGNDLVMAYGAGDQLTIKNYFLNNLFVVEQFTFSDGVTWTQATINTPFFTSFAAPVASGNEDTVIPVTFASLIAQGNEAVPGDTINAFVIKAVSTGTLRIGTSEVTAIAWNAQTNNTVDATHSAYWTPAANVYGTLNAFTAVAKDTAGVESTTPVQATVAVAAVNDVPVATNDTLAATEDTAITYTAAQLLDNDTDADDDILSIYSVTSGSNGTAVLNGDGTVTFTPNASFNGVANFTYIATDGIAQSNSATVTVNVAAANDVPVVASVNVTGAVTEQVAPVGNLTSSGTIAFTDVDTTDAHTVSVTSTSPSPLGALIPTVTTDTTGTGLGGLISWSYSVADSAVEYLAAGQTKVETFTITLDDGNGGLVDRTITVTITGTNDVPVVALTNVTGAVTEQVTPAGNLSSSGTIAFTDVDLTDIHTVNVTSSSLDPLGTLTPTVSTDTTGTGLGGVINWNYSVADSAVEYLAAGQTKVETFTITLDDGNGGLVDRTVSVTITGTNDVPVVAATDVTGAVTELATPTGDITDTGTITFTDVDLTDIHTVSVTSTLGSPLGTLTPSVSTDTTDTGLGGVISWSYSVAASAVEYLAAGQTKVDTFTLTLNDGHGGTVDRSVNVTITGTNDAPVVDLVNVTGAVTEQATPAGSLTSTGTINFTDVDLTDTHTANVTSTSLNPLGTLTPIVSTDTGGTGLGGVISWSYSVADSAVEYLAAGQTKVETFTITLNDGHGGTVDRTVTVTITGTNDAPVVATTNVTGAVTEQVTPAGNLTSAGTITFTDVDLTDTHTISVLSTSTTPLGTLIPAISADTVNGLGGVISWSYSVADSVVEYLAAGQTKVETFTVRLDDGHGGTVDRTVSVTITGTNDVPVVAATDVTGAVTELVTPTGNITDTGTITFTDVDLTDLHTVSVITTSASPLGTLTPSVSTDTTGTGLGGVITWNYSVAASAVEFLAAGQAKVETFTIRLDDGHGGTVDRTVSVTITGTNDVPVANSDTLSASQDTAITYTAAQLLGNDIDVDAGTTLTIFSVTSGSNGTAVLNGNGTVTFTPNAGYTGAANFTYIATDGTAQSNSATVTVNVGSNASQSFVATTGNDVFTGTGANDTVIYTSGATQGVTVNLALQPAQQITVGSGLDTLSGIENLVGSNFADRLTGDANNNNLNGGAGADTLTGGAGNDTFVVNVISTGVLEDTVTEAVGAGTDTLLVQGNYAGVVRTITAPVNIEVFDISATGTSLLNLTANVAGTNVTLIGNAGRNSLTGSTGNNIFTGGAGVDTLIGGGGNDTYNVGITAAGLLEDTVTGGTGIDTIVVTGTSTNAAATTLTAGTTIENYNISGTGSSKLNLTGNTLANSLTGNAAANAINGGTGADAMLGGLGNDTYAVDNIADVVTENVGEGTDLINSSVSYSLLTKGANVENLTLSGTAAIIATGNNGDNVLTGNTGLNTLTGGLGNDTYFVQNASNGVVLGDVVVENAGEGTDTVNSSVTFVLDANIENLNLTGTGIIDGKGNALANILNGNASANTLNDGGAGGTDTLVGGAGNDTYVINNSSDVIIELVGGGTDSISSAVSYTLNTANVENIILTGIASINATGDAGANTLTGNAGNNVLTGGAGVDTLIGGGGNDTYVVNITAAGALQDVVTGNTGIDTIQVIGTSTNVAAVTLTAAATIEKYDISLTGSSLLNVTGNVLTNTLTGNNANNTISDGGIGGLGDSLIGGLGNDIYTVNNSTDKIIELAGEGTELVNSAVSYNMSLNALNVENLILGGITAINGTGNNDGNTLTGNSAINTLIGNGGDDILIGKAGNDILTGGVGADTFWYDTATNSRTNIDTITDFVSGTDKLQFSVSVLTGLTPTGQFTANDPRFYSSSNGLAHLTTDRLIYNTSNGNLSYDSDGSGRNAAVIIEVLTGAPTLVASDIWTV